MYWYPPLHEDDKAHTDNKKETEKPKHAPSEGQANSTKASHHADHAAYHNDKHMKARAEGDHELAGKHEEAAAAHDKARVQHRDVEKGHVTKKNTFFNRLKGQEETTGKHAEKANEATDDAEKKSKSFKH